MFPISVVLAVTAAGLVIAVTGLVNQTMVNVIAVIGIPAATLAVQSIIAIQLMRQPSSSADGAKAIRQAIEV